MKLQSIAFVLIIRINIEVYGQSYNDLTNQFATKNKENIVHSWKDMFEDEALEFGAGKSLFGWHRELDMSMSFSLRYNSRPTTSPILIPISRPKIVTQAAKSPHSLSPSSLPSTTSTSSLELSPIKPSLGLSSTSSSTPSTSVTVHFSSSSEPIASSISNIPLSTGNPISSLSPTAILPILSPSSLIKAPFTNTPFFVSPVKRSAVPSTGILSQSVTNIEAIGVYDCFNHHFIHTSQIVNGSTVINLSFAYAAEVEGSEVSSTFIQSLEYLLLKSAIIAALQCNASEYWQHLSGERQDLLVSTDVLGNCNATRDDSTCFVLESELAFMVDKIVNPQHMSYLAYVAIQRDMLKDIFIENFEGALLKLTYLAPLPLVPPPNDTQPLDMFGRYHSGGEHSRVRSWTIGACIAMSTGGVVTLAAWFYSHRAGSKAHCIAEKQSISHSSLFSIGLDHTNEA